MKVCHSQVKGEGGDGHCVEVHRQVQHLQPDQARHPRLVGPLKKVRGPLRSWGHLPVVTALWGSLRGSCLWGVGPPSPGRGGQGPPSPRLVQCHSCAHVVRAGGTVVQAVWRAPAHQTGSWLFSAHQGYTSVLCTRVHQWSFTANALNIQLR